MLKGFPVTTMPRRYKLSEKELLDLLKNLDQVAYLLRSVLVKSQEDATIIKVKAANDMVDHVMSSIHALIVDAFNQTGEG